MINSLRLRAQDAQSKVILLLIAGLTIGAYGSKMQGKLLHLGGSTVPTAMPVGIEIDAGNITIYLRHSPRDDPWRFTYYSDDGAIKYNNDESPQFTTEWDPQLTQKEGEFAHFVKALRTDKPTNDSDYKIYDMRIVTNQRTTNRILKAIGKSLPSAIRIAPTNSLPQLIQKRKLTERIPDDQLKRMLRWTGKLVNVAGKEATNEIEIDLAPPGRRPYQNGENFSFILRLKGSKTNHWLVRLTEPNWICTASDGRVTHTMKAEELNSSRFGNVIELQFETDPETRKEMFEPLIEIVEFMKFPPKSV